MKNGVFTSAGYCVGWRLRAGDRKRTHLTFQPSAVHREGASWESGKVMMGLRSAPCKLFPKLPGPYVVQGWLGSVHVITLSEAWHPPLGTHLREPFCRRWGQGPGASPACRGEGGTPDPQPWPCWCRGREHWVCFQAASSWGVNLGSPGVFNWTGQGV